MFAQRVYKRAIAFCCPRYRFRILKETLTSLMSIARGKYHESCKLELEVNSKSGSFKRVIVRWLIL